MKAKRRHWRDLNFAQRSAIVVIAAVEFGMLVATQIDIRRRPASQINGPKLMWTLIAFINFFGPLAYFVFGRKRPA